MARPAPVFCPTGCNALDEFIDKLKKRMKTRGMNVRQLAIEAGVGYPYLYRVLKGEQIPSIDWMEKVGKAVGLTIKISIR